MTEETRVSFLGIPVEGSGGHDHNTNKQRPREEFAPIVQALLDDPFIREFGWTQYTPYFNDGDVCTFSAGDPWFLTTADVEHGEMEEDYEYEARLSQWSTHPTLGGEGNTKYPETLAKADALSKALVGGDFDHVLLDLFGDHAEIHVTREKIVVDSYEHD